MTSEVCVIGAGIIGVTTALELQDRGIDVLLVDKGEPGMQTSFGNAGVLSASTVLTVNNPGLFRNLPKLLTGSASYFEYDSAYALSESRWLVTFFQRALSRYSATTARALLGLQRLSIDRHIDLVASAGATDILSEKGWLKVYRDAGAYNVSRRERDLMRQFGVNFQELSSDDVRALEPALDRTYEYGLLLTESWSVEKPLDLTRAYLKLFRERGGRHQRMHVVGITDEDGWRIVGEDQSELQARKVVIACGPWAPDICRDLGYRVPMAWERGYHVHVESPEVQLQRPVLDTRHGFVMAPQGQLTRITSGVQFAHRDAPPSYGQMRSAVAAARECAEFGMQVDETPWLGARPTMPDGLPVIGRANRHDELWFNFGHQHIGMSTSTGSAMMLADMLTRQPGNEQLKVACAPGRFGL